MKPSNTVAKAAHCLAWVIAFILAMLPFHAFLTVWLASAVGHYTLIRLWKEFLLIFVLAGSLYLVAANAGLRRQFFRLRLIRLILIYVLLLLVNGFIAYAHHGVTAKALAYGELIDLRFLGFFLMALVVANQSQFLKQNWRAVLVIPASLVIIFGLMQYLLLPYDFLKHFGYGTDTISPYETINNNINHIRVASTLRGANPLGAYLILAISAGASLLVAAKKRRPSEYFWLGSALLLLVFSFSRSAWIGAIISLLIVVWLSLKSARLKKRMLIAAGVAVIFAGLLGLSLRHNTSFEEAILHTDKNSKALVSSNQGHAAAFKNGIKDIIHQPLGAGVGTAGPASIYNENKGRIAENYYLQIGQEAGVLAMAVFIAIIILVGRELWLRRADPLAIALLASLAGLSFVNMLSHAWADDTISYLWWGLAAIYLAPAILKANKHKANEKPHSQPA